MTLEAILDFDLVVPGATLFAEDFDHPLQPEPAPEPEVIEPSFNLAELEGAKSAAWQAGYDAAIEAATAADEAVARAAIAAIAAQLDAARDAASLLVEPCAEAIARLLLDSLRIALPALCAQHGEAELRAVIRVVLPALVQEPAITARVHPRLAATVAAELEHLDPELAPRIRIVTDATMRPGDARIHWRNGSATRDTAALWNQVAEALAPAGLLPAPTELRETVDAG
jgi:flagellar biosynthesis/type III secretory pathway protein FliH